MMVNRTNPYADLDARLERQYGLPTGYLSRVAQIESSNNPNARNPNSSAGGRFQFINSTAKQYNLADRYDPDQATAAAARLASDNRAILRRSLGREPTAAELYLAHQQGGGGAAKLLGNPDAPAADAVGSNAIRLNGGSADMTGGDFSTLWTRKYGGGAAPDVGAQSWAGSAPTPGVTLNSTPAQPVAQTATPAPAGPAAEPQTALQKAGTLFEDKDFAAGVAGLAKGMGLGSGSAQGVQQPAPVAPLQVEPDDSAQRMAAAQPLLASLLQKRRGRVPGFSIGGMT